MKPRAVGVIFADQVEVGDIVFASYHRSRRASATADESVRCCGAGDDGDFVCAWVRVAQIKHHTDTSVTMLSEPESGTDGVFLNARRWVEYPRDAPLVLGVPEGTEA